MHTSTAIVKSEMTYRSSRVRDEVRAARRGRARARRHRLGIEEREIG